MTQNLRQNRGITLVALVITIIVLLILAGITISLTIGQDGIITTAQQAGKNYVQAKDDEDAQIASLEAEATDIINNGVKVYNVGDEITVKGESFFVLKQTDDTITLIAKYGLSKDDDFTKQADSLDLLATQTKFSETYSTLVDVTTVSSAQNVDLNDDATFLADTTSAIYKADAYAKTIGGSTAKGGLLTYTEVTETYKDLEDIIYANYYTREANHLTYCWLATSKDATHLWTAIGEAAGSNACYGDGLMSDDSTNYWYSIRPVITIPKSAL